MGNGERTNVIVVGAGASKEFDLPTGDELARKISNFCRVEIENIGKIKASNPALGRAITSIAERKGRGGDTRQYFNAARDIAVNMPLAPSIDNFLDTRRADEFIVDVGKIAIASCILEAERKSKLFVSDENIYNRINFNSLNDTWLQKLFKILVAQRNFEQFLEALQNIVFISFNYDRCIQQYLINAAVSYFSLDHESANRVQTSLAVYHPYGSLGDLSLSDTRTVDFGAATNGMAIDRYERIRTFTEGMEHPRTHPLILQYISDASVLIFLGFSFLPLNINMLKPQESKSKDRILLTTLGLSKDSTEMIMSELASEFSPVNPGRVRGFDGTCAQLFHEHHRYLITRNSA